jgi:hypothetical protein
MVDNFEIIKTLLDFSNPNTFYFIQILKRRKENPEMKSGTSVIDNFYIYEMNDLDKLRDKIIDRCEKHNARAYINLNKLNLEKIALYTQKHIIDCIINKDFRGVKNAYATVCGSHHSEKNKRWIIDLDGPLSEDKYISAIKEMIIEELGPGYKILADIPTKNGIHIITNPFNIEKFKIKIKQYEHYFPLSDEVKSELVKLAIQKNSPTLLYIHK